MSAHTYFIIGFLFHIGYIGRGWKPSEDGHYDWSDISGIIILSAACSPVWPVTLGYDLALIRSKP